MATCNKVAKLFALQVGRDFAVENCELHVRKLKLLNSLHPTQERLLADSSFASLCRGCLCYERLKIGFIIVIHAFKVCVKLCTALFASCFAREYLF